MNELDERPVEMQAPVEAATAEDSSRRWRDGPFLLAIALSVIGVLFVLLGRVTILPWISDERRHESVRRVWVQLSRNLPDVGFPTLEKIGFWLLVLAVAALSVLLLILASQVRDGDEPGAGEAA